MEMIIALHQAPVGQNPTNKPTTCLKARQEEEGDEEINKGDAWKSSHYINSPGLSSFQTF